MEVKKFSLQDKYNRDLTWACLSKIFSTKSDFFSSFLAKKHSKNFNLRCKQNFQVSKHTNYLSSFASLFFGLAPSKALSDNGFFNVGGLTLGSVPMSYCCCSFVVEDFWFYFRCLNSKFLFLGILIWNEKSYEFWVLLEKPKEGKKYLDYLILLWNFCVVDLIEMFKMFKMDLLERSSLIIINFFNNRVEGFHVLIDLGLFFSIVSPLGVNSFG